MRATIMGWGAQNNNDHAAPTHELKTLVTETKECPPGLDGVWAYTDLTEQKHIPKFICIGAPELTGGPCDGDEGGMTQQKVQKITSVLW